jgi:hypothetical protein
MKVLTFAMIWGGVAALGLSGCKSLSPPICYTPGPGCPDGSHPYSGEEPSTRDILTEIDQSDEEALQSRAQSFTEQYFLSEEQALGLAQAVRDYTQLRERTAQDLEEFALRVYGINSFEIAQALGQAQLGNPVPLNDLIEKSAQHFGTSASTMRALVDELHGQALRDHGIEL